MSSENEDKPKDDATTKSAGWPEVKKAAETKRYELSLVGAEISKRIADNNGLLDPSIFYLKHINFLEIAKTTLTELPDKVELLVNLTSLLCYSNQLSSIPIGVGKLVHLKNLDLSNNKITELPSSLSQLKELAAINLSGNQLQTLFPFDGLSKLAVLDISRNNFTKLPDDLLNAASTLENLSQLNASFNQLNELSDGIIDLPAIKLLNLENNQLTQVPSALCQCVKLKDLMMKENRLKDNRLKKLVEQDKGKAIIEYLERVYIEECKSKPKPKQKSSSAAAKKKQANDAVVEYDLVKVLHSSYTGVEKFSFGAEVSVLESVLDVRPFIVCCMLRQIDLETPGNFKKFLNIQTKIQDETCDKRTLATIATHDLEKVKSNLIYEAREPENIEFFPLGRKTSVFASEYYAKLMEEAEAERKAKKRNQLSGIYKYLNLLDNQTKFPFVQDKLGNIISLPPLTNSENTKMATSTKNILIEVTSSKSIEICKKVMEELLVEMLNAGIASNDLVERVEALSMNSETNNTENASSNDADAESANRKLRRTIIIQQVRVVDAKGTLKSVYPSRVDLEFNNSNKIEVKRLYDEQQ